MQKYNVDHDTAAAAMGDFAHDKLVIKWSKGQYEVLFGPDGIMESGDELPGGA